MENEIMNNEDVMVVAEEYTPSNSDRQSKILCTLRSY